MKKKIFINGEEVEFTLLAAKDETLEFELSGEKYIYSKNSSTFNSLVLKRDNFNLNIPFAVDGGKGIYASISGSDVYLEIPKKGRTAKKGDEAGHMVSPMPGKIFKIMKSEGIEVKKGEPILIMEAMKMEHTIRANISGVIEKIFYKEGEQIDGGVELVKITE